ncbi:hydroxysqualene dehydroxylase HpnE [Aldersonia sp. NBC_00410]|uniref:hydroxysqualene dehydroxylase HpnE n=1 Tax=Aldersonia sp. NBC_00410 TaxID=2975954 RepID=UPI00225ACFA2|nr:hydroxysqualene dehydroxylase HpnE [Aldersonia sp. NBC_00410]MCX5043746.1 hydroxysqualene dehydroxylase HpnE [Aldersonia sp. NBC_00410]
MSEHRVAVIGGGLAGITAALRCADAGAAVTLYEARGFLGGLTFSFQRGDLWVDNGQHVFLRCCTSYLALLDRLGVTGSIALQPRLDIAVRSPGAAGRLRRNGLPAPLHLSGSLLRYPWLSHTERIRFARAALALRAVDRDDARTDRRSFGAWLRAHGQSERAIATLWDLVGIATLNARADDASLALAATVFQIGMLNANSAGDIGWSIVPLQQLHGTSAATALTRAGAQVRLRAKVTELGASGAGWTVSTAAGSDGFDDVVLAVPPPVAEHIAPPGAIALPTGWAEQLGSTPIVNVHVVVDRPVLHSPFLAGVDSPVQWVFDRTPQSGLAQGQYLAISLSAADDVIDVATADLRARFLPALAELLPGFAAAREVDFFVTRQRTATFRSAPGNARYRPPPATAFCGLYLAGAWTDTGWPATMEGTVRSGDAAAAAVLDSARARAAKEVA